MSIKLTQKQAKQKVLDKHGGKINLISKFTRAIDKHQFDCDCGNTWWAVYASVANSGTGCPKCAALNLGKTKVLTQGEAVQKVLNRHNGSLWLISRYTETNNKHEFECQCGNTWWAVFTSVANSGRGCPVCSQIQRYITRFKPNKYRKSKNYKNCIEIQLTDKKGKQNGICLIDKEDWPRIKHLRWSLSNGYVNNSKVGRLHRFLMLCPSNRFVDHKFHNLLDNRKSKLRLCTNKENLRNRKPSKQKLKGVTPRNSKYIAVITVDSKEIWLGTSKTKRKAAILYDRGALRYFKNFACLNFPLKKTKFKNIMKHVEKYVVVIDDIPKGVYKTLKRAKNRLTKIKET